MRLSDLFTPEEFARNASDKTETDKRVEEIATGILPYTEELSRNTAMPDNVITIVSTALALVDSLLRKKSESNSVN